MTDTTTDEFDEHARNVKIVTEAVAQMLPTFNANGLEPEQFFEGSVKGAVVGLMMAGGTVFDAADALEDIAEALRTVDPDDKPHLRVVQ